MALKVYIAYGTGADQVIALRLQVLAAVNGLTVYVPPASTRQPTTTSPDPQSGERLRESDVVLGVITRGISEACRQELNVANSLGKKTMVFAEPTLASWLQPFFPSNLVIIDPTHPGEAEQAVVEFLKQVEIESQARSALIALGTLALGLLLFAPQE